MVDYNIKIKTCSLYSSKFEYKVYTCTMTCCFFLGRTQAFCKDMTKYKYNDSDQKYQGKYHIGNFSQWSDKNMRRHFRKY